MQRSVIFVLINVLLERYCWTGTTNILVMYLHNKLGFDEATSTALYHTVELLTFILPVVAAIIADSYWGLYQTLVCTSLVYLMGNFTIALGAIETFDLPRVAITLIGMTFFVTNGCVRSCLNTFGPDQYKLPEQAEEFASFFFLQMVFIKLGALLGRFVNPIFREDVQCFGASDCYPLAFGFPAVVLFFGVAILIFARKSFVRKPTSENIIGKVFKCAFYSLKMKLTHPHVKKAHWLDFAEGKFEKELVESTKIVSKTLTIFLGIALYWSCFMQQNSRWIYQAAKMNGNLGFYRLKPDQIIAMNPVTSLIFTPICNFYVFPLLARCGLGSLLNRVAIGGFLCIASFVLATIVEVHIQNHFISMLWLFPQYALSALSEIFVLVSLLNFAYAEAPANMKSVMTSMVYLTTALGISIIPVVSGSRVFRSQAAEFAFFTALLFVNMIVFCFLVRTYNRRKHLIVTEKSLK